MSSSIPPAKRRRIDTASETLKKPFKSPLVKRPQVGTNPASSPLTPAPQRRAPISTPTPSKTFTSHRRPGRGLQVVTPSKPPPSDGFTPEESDLLTKLRHRRKEAEARAREAEARVELVRQAAKIEESGENEKLTELVWKWKGACRLAAEDLFELIRGRVDSMGGGDAWRETRRKQAGFWDDEEEAKRRKARDDGEGADEREELEGREGENGDVNEYEDVNEERDFTMQMMLTSLNIDPRVVGYDPAEDKWQDAG